MLMFPERPDSADFDANVTINDARVEVENIYQDALPGFADDEDRVKFPKKVLTKDSDHWGQYKDHFAQIQHGRCGYCELPAIGTQYGDVEHFRPKGQVSILNPEKQGQEKSDLSNVAGRKTIRTIGTGYWWDAYTWSNYLLSCSICNQAWKKNFFPIDVEPNARLRPRKGAVEVELLLHPFGDDDPADHFVYELSGIVRGITPKGIATIETVGLWRPSLVTKRRKVLNSLIRLLNEMTAPNAEPSLVKSHALTILERGAIDWPMFPGMTRTFFRQASGMEWNELEQIAEV